MTSTVKNVKNDYVISAFLDQDKQYYNNKALCSTGRFPGEGGIVAPGMSCQYMVRFAPDSLADYEDALVVETQLPYPLIVPIEARRSPPILTCESK